MADAKQFARQSANRPVRCALAISGPILAAALLLSGCAVSVTSVGSTGSAAAPARHLSLSDIGNVVVGAAQTRHSAIDVRLSIRRTTARTDLSAVVERFAWSLGDSEIQVWAYGWPLATSDAAGAFSGGELVVDEPLPVGRYAVVYRDPDGTLHSLGSVAIQASSPQKNGDAVGVALAALIAVMFVVQVVARFTRRSTSPSDTIARLSVWARHHRTESAVSLQRRRSSRSRDPIVPNL